MSFPPSSGAMKPKPFVVLNHFTVPLGIAVLSIGWPHRGRYRIGI
jgi:hypothetical protein